MIKESTCCFTGYRPEKLPYHTSEKATEIIDIKLKINKYIIDLIENKGYTTFLTGMAKGFDIMAAEIVLMLKQKYPHIFLVCVIPCKTQTRGWNEDWKSRYKYILDNSDNIIYTSMEYTAYCMFARNRYLVDNSSCVICYYDGKSGGTAYTIKYAMQKKLEIYNTATDNYF